MVHFPPWKTLLILLVCVLGAVFSAPNVLPRDQAETLPLETVNLGLDLQGGAHLLALVEGEQVIRQNLRSIEDQLRASLRGEGILYLGLGARGTSVRFTVKETTRVDDALAIAREVARDATQESLISPLFQSTPDLAVAADGQLISVTYSDEALATLRSSLVDQSIEIIRARIDPDGVTEPVIQRQGTDRILIQVPGEDDPEELKRKIATTARLSFQFLDENVPQVCTGRTPPGATRMRERVAPEMLARDPDMVRQCYVVRNAVIVDGKRLTNARSGTDQNGQPAVIITFDSVGADRFARATSRENVGRRFAIVLDNEVVSAPVIRETIPGGTAQITGNFTFQSAEEDALLLRAGALPAKLTFLEERTVGPGMGQDNIDAGVLACVVGLALVLVFMMLSYGLFGVMANVALFVNLMLLLGALSLFQATLTLPGIAGIVLTVGMAVDANVLIFERIREETARGRTPITAVDAGYRQALSTIIDANLTTLIAALLLFGFGSGPVKGFAVTLSIGLITSMFSAVMLTRLMVATYLRTRRPKALPI